MSGARVGGRGVGGRGVGGDGCRARLLRPWSGDLRARGLLSLLPNVSLGIVIDVEPIRWSGRRQFSNARSPIAFARWQHLC